MGSHTTTVAYDKPIPNYIQIATNISIWLDTPLLSGGGIYTWHCWQAGWFYHCTHNVARRPKVTLPTPNYITAKVLVQIRRSAFIKSVTRMNNDHRAWTGFIWLKTVQWWTLWEFANEAAGSRRGEEYPDHPFISCSEMTVPCSEALATSCFRKYGRQLLWGGLREPSYTENFPVRRTLVTEKGPKSD